MLCKEINLYEYFGVEKPQGGVGVLYEYVLGRYDYCPERVRPAMLILGGGGYQFVSRREMEPLAMAYCGKGFNCYALDYTVNIPHPVELVEASMAMAYIREKANEHFTDESKVASIGFSAGGHLCGMLATMYDSKEVTKVLGNRKVRPDAVVLSYPVILSCEFAHQGSIDVLTGGKREKDEYFSLDKRVNENSSPAFIWATFEDTCVPCENSLTMATAYRKAGVPFELHIYEHGCHGLSICSAETANEFPYASGWLELTVSWLKSRGFVTEK